MTTQNVNIRKLNVVNTKKKLKIRANENSNASDGQFVGDHARIQVQGKFIENIERVKYNPISSRIASHEHGTKQIERHNCKPVNSQQFNSTIINMNEISQSAIAHNVQAKGAETDYEIFSIKSRGGHSTKFLPAKATTSKLVQTSSSKLKLKKESKSRQIEELKNQLQAIVSQKDKAKKEIYIITGSHAPFKLDSPSNEDANNYLPLEYKPEGRDPNPKPRQNSEPQKVNRLDEKKAQEEVLPVLNRGDLDSREVSSGGVACVSTASQTHRRKVSLTSSEYINLSEPRKKEKDFPKVISTKVRFKEQRCKRSDSAIGEKRAEESGRRNKRMRHREVRRISDILNGNDFYKKRNIMLDEIETAYLKHKHILPKETAEALERNIQKWKAMNVDLYKKPSKQQSNVLDLAEVVKKNENVKPPHATSKPNDLILMNAIVTDVNRKKDTMHINKIPKFVRLEGIQEQAMGNESGSDRRKEHSIIPNDVVRVAPDQEMRLEVSFSHLNVNPVLKVRSSLDSQLNSPLPPESKRQLKDVIPDSEIKCLRPNQQISLVRGGVSFNVDGVGPPKKQKSRIPSGYVTTKNIFSQFKKLEAITLPIMEVRNVYVTDCNNPLKSRRQKSRKRESQRARKSSKSSASSSESTLQLTHIIDEHADTSCGPDNRNQDDLRHLFKSDQDAIAALKYLPPKRREVKDPLKARRSRKLRKTVVSVVEIKPTQQVSSVRSFGGTSSDLPMVPSKETKLLFKSSDGEESSSKIRREVVTVGKANSSIGAGTHTMNYSRNTENMKRSCSATTRENANERKVSCAGEIWSSKRPPSLSGVSTSSGVSLNSDIDNVETTAEHLTVPVEIKSAALTKITEETVSQDTIESSEQSIAARNSVSGKTVRIFGEIGPELHVSGLERGKDKAQYISAPSTSGSKQVTASGNNQQSKGSNKIRTSVPTPTNASEEKAKHSMTSSRSLQDEEIRRLTESVKNSILNEIQAMNMANMNNLVQLILKTKSGSSLKLAQSGRQTNGSSSRSNSVIRELKKPQCETKNPFNTNQQVVIVNSCNANPEPDRVQRPPSAVSLGNTSTRSKLRCSKIPKSIRNPISRSGSIVRSPGILGSESVRLCAKSITSDTKTSLTSAFKETSTPKVNTDGKSLSKFEKRKLYDDALRLKKPKRDDVPVAVFHQGADWVSNLSVNIENAYENDGDLNLNDQAQLQPQKCTEDEEKLKPSVSKQPIQPPVSLEEPPESDERENVYQTFTVMASHPNVTELFKDKFDKSSCKANSKHIVAKPSFHYPPKKVESLFRYNGRQTKIEDDVNSNLEKLSRARINLLDAREHLKNQPLDRNLVFPKSNLCNMYSQSASSIESIKDKCYRSKNNAAHEKERSKDIQRSDSAMLPTKLEKEQGNYLIFKIDQNLQKRATSAVSESYKIFMNNRTTANTGASLILRSKESFLVNAAPLSESGYGSVNGKDRHTSSTSDLQSKPSDVSTIPSWTSSNRGKENQSSQTDCQHRGKSKRMQGKILRYIQSSYTLKDLILSDSSFHASVAGFVEKRISEDLLRPIIQKSLHNFLSGTEFRKELQLDTLKSRTMKSSVINSSSLSPLETCSDSITADATNQMNEPVTGNCEFSTVNEEQCKRDSSSIEFGLMSKSPIRVFLSLSESNRDFAEEECDTKGLETGKQAYHELSALEPSESTCDFGEVLHLYEKQELMVKDFFTSSDLVPSQFDWVVGSGTPLSHLKSRSSILSVLRSKMSRVFKIREKQSKTTTGDRIKEVSVRKPLSELSICADNCNDEEFESRLPTIIENAKSWIAQMNSVQGVRSQLVLCKDALKTTQYFVPLLEAVANNRVTSMIQLYVLLKMLKSDEIASLSDSEQRGRLQKRFGSILHTAEAEAKLQGKVLDNKALKLLKILAMKFEAVEEHHATRISKFIGRGLIANEIGLEAAMAYFAKLQIFKDFQN